MKPIAVFLDEGALDGEARFPSACAVVVGDAPILTEQIDDLIHELTLLPDFQLERGAALLEVNGFHHFDDNFLAAERFRTLLPQMDFEWWCSSNLSAGLDPYTTLPDQFRWIVTKILQKYRGRSVNFVFEQNERLNRGVPELVDSAIEAAGASSGVVTYSIGTKSDKLLSIADYCIAYAKQAIKAWMEACCDNSQLGDNYKYRNFALIEPLCSTLFAFDLKKALSQRSMRLLDHTFRDLSGQHHHSCSQSGGS